MRTLSAGALLTTLIATPVVAQTYFDVNFNDISPGLVLTQPITDPPPLTRPTHVLMDFPGGGDRMDVVTEAGNLTDQPLLLDARPGGLAWVGFLTPNVRTSGSFSVSWDSLVLSLPVSEDPEPFQGILIATWTGNPMVPATLLIHEQWEMRYTPQRTFEVIDATGTRTAGAYTVGQADHFDFNFSLDTGAWQLAVNGSNLVSGMLFPPFEFGATVFMTNGRAHTADPPALVIDNLLIRQISQMALVGDYNGNGMVEQADLDLVLLNWGLATPPIPAGWTADPPTGTIDQDELDRVLLNWGATASASAISTPEPSTLLLAAMLAGLCAAMRRATVGPNARHSREEQPAGAT